MSAIALLTDFGMQDWFVGTMKGVIIGINPQASIVDLTHEIPAGNIQAAAFCLLASYHYFPAQTVFVAVVDPGVGSSRKALALSLDKYYFVGPDNGIFSLIYQKIPTQKRKIYCLKNSKFFLHPVSNTFHGRDIFAPVGAHLSKGISINECGPSLDKIITLDNPGISLIDNRIVGTVIYLDVFGNAFTNISHDALKNISGKEYWVKIDDRFSLAIKNFYHEVPSGSGLALFNSSGYLEVAINQGNAADRYHLTIGTKISIQAH